VTPAGKLAGREKIIFAQRDRKLAEARARRQSRRGAAAGFASNGYGEHSPGGYSLTSGLVGIPITNLSVNPARSTATALFVGGWALAQLWLFWLAPIIGGCLGGLAYALLGTEVEESGQSPLEKLTQQSEARADLAERIDPIS
jgi:hypothetical protein